MKCSLIKFMRFAGSRPSQRGVTLLIAVILTAAFTAIVAAVSGFVFRENVLSQTGKNSAIALFAADTALECFTYHDLVNNLFFGDIDDTETGELAIKCANIGGDFELEYFSPDYPNGTNPNDDGKANATNCDGFNESSSASVHKCYRALGLKLSNDSSANVTFYTYENGGRQYVKIRARGKSGSSVRPVERALEYSYNFDI